MSCVLSIRMGFTKLVRLTSHAGRSGCGCSRHRWRSSRTRCTCSRRGHADACASASGGSPNRRTTNRTTRSASRRPDAHACAWASKCTRSRSSAIRNVCISLPCQPPFMTSDQSSDSRPSRFLPALYHNPIPTVSLATARFLAISRWRWEEKVEAQGGGGEWMGELEAQGGGGEWMPELESEGGGGEWKS